MTRIHWHRRRHLAAILAMLLVFAFLMGMIHKALAQGSASSTPATRDDLTDIVSGLQDQINSKKGQISTLKQQMAAYQQQIHEKEQEAISIGNQLSVLDNQIAKTQLDVQSNQLEIDATNLELGQLQSEIQDKTLKIIKQRAMIAEFLRAIQRTDQRTPVDLLLTEKTLSDFFNDVQFLQESQRELKGALDTVKSFKADLESRESEQSAKRKHLQDIQTQLTQSQDQLKEQKTAQGILADQVAQAQARYEYELGQLKREEENANSDITQIERKLRKTLDEQRLRRLSGETTGWAWPVDPIRGIAAYFHDPNYPFRYVFEHPAIDIRTPQGTPVRAVKGGYVARAKDAGMGYSYVMLVHDNDLSTVYGHLSRIIAKEDTYVEQGDIIGYSGGTPGTPGAGKLTTGPHLHLEFRVSGIPVDPLGYLKL